MLRIVVFWIILFLLFSTQIGIRYSLLRILGIGMKKVQILYDWKFHLFKRTSIKTNIQYIIGWLPTNSFIEVEGMVDESAEQTGVSSEPERTEFRSRSFLQKILVMALPDIGLLAISLMLGHVFCQLSLTEIWNGLYQIYSNEGLFEVVEAIGRIVPNELSLNAILTALYFWGSWLAIVNLFPGPGLDGWYIINLIKEEFIINRYFDKFFDKFHQILSIVFFIPCLILSLLPIYLFISYIIHLFL